MFRYTPLAFIFVLPSLVFGQLSKGEGSAVSIGEKRFECFLPKDFSVQHDPPGVMHKETGTFVVAIKIPANQKTLAVDGLPRSYFEDSRY